MLSKKVNNKKYAPRLVFFNVKKDWDDFWNKKIDFENPILALLTPPHYTNSQNSITSFGHAKTCLILHPRTWNSITILSIAMPDWDIFDFYNSHLIINYFCWLPTIDGCQLINRTAMRNEADSPKIPIPT
jgi:hypothetical protein